MDVDSNEYPAMDFSVGSMSGCGDCSSTRRQASVLLAAFLYFTGENMILMTALPYVTYGVCRDQFPNASVYFCLNINQHPEQERSIQVPLLALRTMVLLVPKLLLLLFLFCCWCRCSVVDVAVVVVGDVGVVCFTIIDVVVVRLLY